MGHRHDGAELRRGCGAAAAPAGRRQRRHLGGHRVEVIWERRPCSASTLRTSSPTRMGSAPAERRTRTPSGATTPPSKSALSIPGIASNSSCSESATGSPLTWPPKIVGACATQDTPPGRRDQSHGRPTRRRLLPANACRRGWEREERRATPPTVARQRRRGPQRLGPQDAAAASPPRSLSSPPWERIVTANRYTRDSPVPSQLGNASAQG